MRNQIKWSFITNSTIVQCQQSDSVQVILTQNLKKWILHLAIASLYNQPIHMSLKLKVCYLFFMLIVFFFTL